MPAPIIITSGSLAVGGVWRGEREVRGFVEAVPEKRGLREVPEKGAKNWVCEREGMKENMVGSGKAVEECGELGWS